MSASATRIHQSPAYELAVTIDTGRHGHHLKFVSFVPIARRPEPQVRFQANLTTVELAELHSAIGRVLAAQAERPTGSSGEPVQR